MGYRDFCSIEMDDGSICGYPQLAKAMCSVHYGRARDGRPMGVAVKRRVSIEKCAHCDTAAYSLGLCKAHWMRERSGRSIAGRVAARGLTDVEHVDALLAAGMWVDDCLIADRIGHSGYATNVKDENGKPIATHRLVYRVKVAEIPAGEQIHHICANRPCINPLHLVAATQRENTAEMLARLSYTRRIAHLELRITDLECENERLRSRLTSTVF